jgi:HK97 family phage major capsid protein
MASARLTALRQQFQTVKTAIDTIERGIPAGEDADDDTQAELDKLFDRAEQIKAELEPLAAKYESLEATAGIIAKLGLTNPAAGTTDRAQQQPETPDISIGEYLTTFNRARALGDRDALEQIQEWRQAYGVIDRAPAQQALADNAGVVPQPVVAPLIKFLDAQRYAINSMRRLPMFTGSGNRPRVTQNTNVAVQAAEFGELATRKMLIVRDALTRGTYGGYVEISEQDEEFTEPAMMQIIIEDLAEMYANVTEDVVADALVAAATNTFELPGATPLNTSPADEVHKGLFTAANQVYTQCKKLPDTLWASPDMWAFIGGLTGSDLRPIYPNLSPMNAGGTMEGVVSWQGNPLGLKFVVSPGFAANTLVLGNSMYAEVREQDKGLARGAFKPGTLSTEVGYRGYLSTYFRAEGFVRIIDAV